MKQISLVIMFVALLLISLGVCAFLKIWIFAEIAGVMIIIMGLVTMYVAREWWLEQ